MKTTLAAVSLASLLAATGAQAAPEAYVLDASHSQILFSYEHLGYSTTWGLFSGFEGQIQFDQEDPANSSVTIELPADSMITGWDARKEHFMSPDFFNAEENNAVTFTSTGIEVTGEDTAIITGDLTINGQTNPLELDAQLTSAGTHPMEGKDWAGFTATGTVLRSDYGLDMFAPAVSDEVELQISIEAMKAE
ncbi:MAG: YceI family protein [Celeribacter sp.]|jgi:polyisoprenoid-binding protein YceI